MSGDTWRTMWVTHGMPCVNMHGTFEVYIRGFTWAVRTSKGVAARRRRSKGKEKRRKREEKGRKGKEKERRKEKKKGEEERKKKGEEERKKKEEKEEVLCSEQTWTAKNPELRYKR